MITADEPLGCTGPAAGLFAQEADQPGLVPAFGVAAAKFRALDLVPARDEHGRRASLGRRAQSRPDCGGAHGPDAEHGGSGIGESVRKPHCHTSSWDSVRLPGGTREVVPPWPALTATSR